MTESRRIALIPARGGSKRLPRKNIIDFRGKPIIAYTIDAARKTGLFERVVVSTEDEEIAAVASEWGAEIALRSECLATDSATVADVCVDFLASEEQRGNVYDVLCVLYATAPLREVSDIKAVVGLIDPGVCDYALAVTDYENPPHQALILKNDAQVEPMWPDLATKRSDALPQLAVDNGSTYAVNVPSFLESRAFYGPRMCAHRMPGNRSVDIDTGEDYKLALYFAELMD